MRAVHLERNGGRNVLDVRELPSPQPRDGEVLVDVAVAGVNYRDIYDREGRLSAPLTLGVEGAGRILALGSGVAELASGDRVAWAGSLGSYAGQVCIPATSAVPVPDAVDDETAAGVLLQGLTAHYLCSSAYVVHPGNVVLIHAGAGGVGLLLTQMVKLRGGHVVATTSPGKADVALEAGADHVIGYDNFADHVLELTGGQGVAAVYDGVGASTFGGSVDALRARGTLISYGWASGPVPPFDLARLGKKSLYVTRTSMAAYLQSREELLSRAADIFLWVGSGELRVTIGGVYELENVRLAHEALESRQTVGKLLLIP